MFRYCLDSLAAKQKIDFLEDAVALHGREVRLSEGSQQVRQTIESIYKNAGYQPPSFAEMQNAAAGDPQETRRIYYWMIKEKILIKVAEDLVYHRDTLEAIKKHIKSKFSSGAKFGVAEFKDLFDITRKHAIPLLEHLDRDKFTRRQGNERILL